MVCKLDFRVEQKKAREKKIPSNVQFIFYVVIIIACSFTLYSLMSFILKFPLTLLPCDDNRSFRTVITSAVIVLMDQFSCDEIAHVPLFELIWINKQRMLDIFRLLLNDISSWLVKILLKNKVRRC